MALTLLNLASQTKGILPIASLPALSGDVTSAAGVAGVTVAKINGVALSSLTTGLLKNTTGTGAPTVATAGTDYTSPSTPTFSSKVVAPAAVAGAASLNMAPGTTPTAPANGDVWTTAAGIFVQVAGATVGPLGAVHTFVVGEIPSGTINGTNATFTLAHTPAVAPTLYLNGQRMLAGSGNDYTLSGTSITMLTVPQSTDVLCADYQY